MIVLPDGIRSIKSNGISKCGELEYVYHYSKISPSSIDSTVLSECDQVKGIYVYEGYDDSSKWSKNVIKGTLEKEVYWYYEESTTTLLIYGKGNMKSKYSSSETAPWVEYRETITTVRIEYGVKNIGNKAFYYNDYVNSDYGYPQLTRVEIGNTVTTIGDEAFSSCSSLTSVIIGTSVTSIGGWTFSDCTSLTSITIPESLTTIGDSAFYGCISLETMFVDSNNNIYSSDEYGVLFNKDKTEIIMYPKRNKITEYTIPSSVTTIGNNTFESCTLLTSVTILDGVTSVGNVVFAGCTSLESITIPKSVTSIGVEVFNGCSNLTSIEVHSDNPNYSSDEYGVLFDKQQTILIQYPLGNPRKEYTILDGVITIGEYSFVSCKTLEQVIIPESVTTIKKQAFRLCTSLTTVTIKSTSISFEDMIFNGCKSLTTIHYYGTSEPSHGSLLFDDCTQTITVYVLTDYTSTTESFCDYTNVVFNRMITSGTCGDSCSYIITPEYQLIINGSGTMTDYEESNQPWNTNKDKITEVVIEEGITSIGSNAFNEMSQLKKVEYKGNTIGCGDNVFENTYSGVIVSNDFEENDFCGAIIAKWNTEGTKAIIEGSCGDDCDCTLDVVSGEMIISGTGTMTEYEESNQSWNLYRNSIKEVVIEEGITTIGSYSFYDMSQLKMIKLPDGVTSIGLNGITNCPELEYVYHYSKISPISIDSTVLSECNNVKGIYVYEGYSEEEQWPSTVSIKRGTLTGGVYWYYSSGEFLVYGNGNMQSSYYDRSQTGGTKAPWVESRETITTVRIESGVKNISDYAFYYYVSETEKGYPQLKTVEIGETVTTIGIYAFSSCTSITSITIPSSVTTLSNTRWKRKPSRRINNNCLFKFFFCF